MTQPETPSSSFSRDDNEPLLGRPENEIDPDLKSMLTDLVKSDKGMLVLLQLCIPEKKIQAYAPRFVNAVKAAFRVALWCTITGVLAWYSSQNEDFLPAEYKSRIPALTLAIIFNASADAASTLRSSLQGLVGTLTAIAFSFLLYQLPDPYHGGGGDGAIIYSPVRPTCQLNPEEVLHANREVMYNWQCTEESKMMSAGEAGPGVTTAFAFLFFAVFVATVLSLNVVMPFRTFAILGATNFMMKFADPKTDVSNFMEFEWTSEMVVTVIVQIAGSLIAFLAVMLPPKTASNTFKILAARVTLGTVDLLNFVNDYYSGETKSLKMNIWNSTRERMHEDLDQQTSKLDSSWWEYFDWGTLGIIRHLMLSHLDMLKDIDRRLGIMHIAVKNEEFDDKHKRAMQVMRPTMMQLVVSVGNLLMHCTVAASDGIFDEKELQDVTKRREAVAAAREKLGNEWKMERMSRGALSREMRTESFFLLELDSIARIVYNFSEQLTSNRPCPINVGLQYVKSIFDINKLRTDYDFRNFIIRNWISMMLAWWWAVLGHRFDATILVNVVLMMTLLSGNALMMNLQKLQALVLGSLAGVTIYRAFFWCDPFIQFSKMFVLFVYILFSMFIANYSSEFATVGLLLAVQGGSNLLKQCEDPPSFGDIMIAQSNEFKALKKFAFAICVVTVVDMFLKREPASDQVNVQMTDALTKTFKYLRDFLNLEINESEEQGALWEDSKKVTDEIEKHLDKVASLLGAADSEPRFSKCPFKATFCAQLVENIRDLQSHTMCMVRRSQFPAPGVINIMSRMKAFAPVKKDLLETLKDAEELALKVLTYEGFGAMDPKEFSDVLEKGSTDKLDGVDELVDEIRKSNALKKEPMDCPLEESMLSRLCVVAEMLEVVTRDVHSILQVAVVNM
jgi:hypothetical protein